MKHYALPSKLALPAAALGALATSPASASITYYDAGDRTVLQNGSSIYFDLISGDVSDVASSSDFRLWATGGSNWHNVYARTPANGQTLCYYTSTNWGYSKRLALNTDIGSSSAVWAAPSTNYLRYSWDGSEYGIWAANTRGYLGLRIDDGTGSFSYGWADISVGNTSVTLHSFAYETTKNASIQAGAIPEPSTYAAITGLLAGSAALYARRRKRAA